MLYSRLRRYEDRKFKKRLIWALGGSVALVVFIFIFGLKLLVGFSLLLDRLHGASPTEKQSQSLILPPILDPLPEATNSATITITGKGDPGMKIVFYIDEEESTNLPVESDGTFALTKKLADGEHTVSTKAKNDKDLMSDLSNVITITIKRNKPELTVSNPQDGERIVGDSNALVVKGKTSSDNTVAINDRLAVVSNDGSFSYIYSLIDGENTLRIVASDPAGNKETVDRRVTYSK